MQSDDKYTLKPSLAEKFEGIIWKVEIDAEESLITIEARNIQDHTTSFSSFDFTNGQCLFRNVSVNQSWNWGLDRVYKGISFLHSRVAEESPEHKGIIALDRSGKILWQLFNKTLYDISTEGLVAYDPKIQPKRLELLDAQNGNLLKSNISNYESFQAAIQIPLLIPYHPGISPFIPPNVDGEIAVLNFNNRDCMAYHIHNGENFTQQLIITQGDKLLLRDNLAENIRKRNPEAFFNSRNYLFCIRGEKKEIVSYLV